MYIYLPIAEQPINAFIVLGIGWLVGIIMGMVGICLLYTSDAADES